MNQNFYSIKSSLLCFVFLLGALICVTTESIAATKTWTGTTSSDWTVGSNWGGSAPAVGDAILIPGGLTNYPVISSSVSSVLTISINSSGTGASLTINSGGALTATGLITINANGTLTMNAGTATLAGITSSGSFNMNGGTLTSTVDIILSTSGTTLNQTNGTIWMATNTSTNPTDNLKITAGTVNQSGGTLYVRDFDPSAGTFNQTGSSALFRIFHDWKPSGTFSFNATNGTYRVSGASGPGLSYVLSTVQFYNVVVDAGIEPDFGNKASSTIRVAGNYTDSNTVALTITNPYTVLFNGSSAQTITTSRGANNSFSSLTISNSSGGVSLANSINMNAALTISAGSTLALGVNNLGSSTVSTAPSSLTLEHGTVGSSITGSGTLTLGGDVTMSTTTGANGASISCPVALGATRTFTIADNTGVTDDLSISGIISGATFGVTKAGAGTLTLSGANTFTGKTVISAGAISINSLASVSGGSSALGAPTTTANGTIDISGTGTLIYTGSGHSSNRVINLTADGGTLDASGSGALTLSGGVTGNTFNLNLKGTGNGSQTGVIATTSGTLTKSGTGTWTLSGANTYTGTSTISAGILKVGASSTVNSSSPTGTTGVITVADGATLDMNGYSYTSGHTQAISINGAGVSSVGAISNSSSAASTLIGPITFSTAASINGEGGLLNIIGIPVSGATAITLGGAVGGSISTVVAGARNLIKSGVGTWTLSGANTYSGATTISAGTLKLGASSSLSASGPLGTSAGGVTVSSGATLDLNGKSLSGQAKEPCTLNGTGVSNLGALTNNGSLESDSARYSGLITLASSSTIGTAKKIRLDTSISGSYLLTKVGSDSLIMAPYKSTIGGLNISSGVFKSTSDSLKLTGDFTNDSIFVHNNGIVALTGSAAQKIGGSKSITFYRLALNGSGVDTLDVMAYVDSSLNFKKGYLKENTGDTMVFKSGSAAWNASDLSFVIGPVKKIGDTAFTFPIGAYNSVKRARYSVTVTNYDSSYTYSPITITPAGTSVAADFFIAQYHRESPSGKSNLIRKSNTSSRNTRAMEFLSSTEYWTVKRRDTVSTSSIGLKVYWNPYSGTDSGNYIVDTSKAKIAHLYGNGSGNKIWELATDAG